MHLIFNSIIGLIIVQGKYSNSQYTSCMQILDLILHNSFLNNLGVFGQDCGGDFFGPSGKIQSPDWPKDYPANSNCSWSIICEDGGKPKISVLWADVKNTIEWNEEAGCR